MTNEIFEKYNEKYGLSVEEIEKSIEGGFEKLPAGIYLLKIETAGIVEKEKDGEFYPQAKIQFNVEAGEVEGFENRKVFYNSNLNPYYHPTDESKNLTSSQKVGMVFRFLKEIDEELVTIYHDKTKEANSMGEVLTALDTCLIAMQDAGKTFKCAISYRKTNGVESDFPNYKVIVEEE